MNILQSIFTDYYEHIIYQLHPRPAVIVVILPMAVPCMVALIVVNLNLFPSGARAAFVLPAVTSTIKCAPFTCPVS